MSRRRRSCAVMVVDAFCAGERSVAHCERAATPDGSMMASSTAIVPLIMVNLIFEN